MANYLATLLSLDNEYAQKDFSPERDEISPHTCHQLMTRQAITTMALSRLRNTRQRLQDKGTMDSPSVQGLITLARITAWCDAPQFASKPPE